MATTEERNDLPVHQPTPDPDPGPPEGMGEKVAKVVVPSDHRDVDDRDDRKDRDAADKKAEKDAKASS